MDTKFSWNWFHEKNQYHHHQANLPPSLKYNNNNHNLTNSFRNNNNLNIANQYLDDLPLKYNNLSTSSNNNFRNSHNNNYILNIFDLKLNPWLWTENHIWKVKKLHSVPLEELKSWKNLWPRFQMPNGDSE